jgi:hypothetical protein
MARASKEFQKFAKLTDRLLAVPRDVVQQRIEQHRKKVAATPNKLKPGPNRQVR